MLCSRCKFTFRDPENIKNIQEIDVCTLCEEEINRDMVTPQDRGDIRIMNDKD